MIAGSFVEILILSIPWLSDRPWSKWQIITISIMTLFVLVLITKRQREQERNRKLRSRYKEQLLENSFIGGMSWGLYNKSRHTGNDLKKDRLAPVHKHQNKKHLQTKEPLEKPHERTKAFHSYTNIYKPTREHSEQEISESTADNEKLQCELAKLAKAESKIAEMTAEFRQLQKEEFQVEQISEHQIVTELAVETPVSRKTKRRNKMYKQQHRTVEGVRQKLCKKCNKWKPESEFHKSSSSRDNLAESCKICKNNAAREHRRRRKAAQR